MLTKKKKVEAGREGKREGLPEIQLPWKQQGTISLAQAVLDRDVDLYWRRGNSREEGKKTEKEKWREDIIMERGVYKGSKRG